MNSKLYTLAQWTWGLPQTLIGAAVYLAHRGENHFEYNGASVTTWKHDSGVSLGKFIFVPEEHSGFLLDHEYGHTIQSLMLGPAYLVLVGAPSFIWSRLPYFSRKRKETGRSYYSVPFEKTANTLGARASAKKPQKKPKAEGPSTKESK